VWSLLARIASAVSGSQEAPLEIRVSGVEGPNIGAVERFAREGLLTDPLDKPFEELRKTRFEHAMCGAAVRSLNDIRVALGLPALYLPAHRVHILSDDEYARVFGKNADNLGISLGIHAYIPRSDDRLKFASTVTHEIVHLACLKRFRVQTEAVKEDGTLSGDITITSIRSGLRRSDDSYEGLNEAITEITASAVRENLSRVRNPLSNAEIEELMCWSGYDPQIQLFEALAKRVWDDDVEGFTVAMWDYMTGTNCFLRAVRREFGGQAKVLRFMGVMPKSAFFAARAMGFDEVAESIAEDLPEDDESE